MTAQEIVDWMKPLGSDSYKRTLLTHGAQEPVYGVKIEEMQKVRKQVKKDYTLALDLYDTGIFDAMYLAGLIADDLKMTKDDLRHWAEKANCRTLRSYTVPWVASESLHGRELALEWIASADEAIAATGWATYSSLVSIKGDAELDLAEIEGMLRRVGETIHQQPNDVRSVMNDFVISVGCYVAPLTAVALETAAKMGKVTVIKEGTACKVPYAPDYIQKVQARGTIGKKRKTAKC